MNKEMPVNVVCENCRHTVPGNKAHDGYCDNCHKVFKAKELQE